MFTIAWGCVTGITYDGVECRHLVPVIVNDVPIFGRGDDNDVGDDDDDGGENRPVRERHRHRSVIQHERQSSRWE